MSGRSYFSRKTFHFLRDLKENNDRDWFAANRARYEEDLRDPALRLIEDFAPELSELSRHFMATPRSLFRIHRDVRFSKDKSPYKTSAGIHFRHETSKDAHAPGFYFHIEPGQVFVALGIWHPDSKTLRTVRERIAEDGASWKRVSRGKRFTESFTLEGDALKRTPKGFDPEHPLMDDLKRKDFIAVKRVPQAFATSAQLPQTLAKEYRAGVPFMRFLCDALGVAF